MDSAVAPILGSGLQRGDLWNAPTGWNSQYTHRVYWASAYGSEFADLLRGRGPALFVCVGIRHLPTNAMSLKSRAAQDQAEIFFSYSELTWRLWHAEHSLKWEIVAIWLL